MKKMCYIFVLLICLFLTSCGDEKPTQEFYYPDSADTTQGLILEYDDDYLWRGYVVKGCISNDIEEITIPSQFKDYDVTCISDNAFDGCKKLKTIIIPNTIVKIGREAFTNCKSLKEITIPNSVVIFNGFEYDKATKEVLSYSLFDGCTSLEKISLPSKMLCETSILASTFRYSFTYFFKRNIPSTLKEIRVVGDTVPINAFKDCSSIETFVLDGTIAIGSYSFENCTGIKKITIPNTVTQISSYAFINCSSLEEINIPCSVERIDLKSFQGCTSLKKISIPFAGEKKGSYISRDLAYIFGETPATLEEIIITDDGLNQTTFKNCTCIKKVSIDGDKTSTYQESFYNCRSLEEIVFNCIVKNISYKSFEKCPSLKEISFLKGIDSIESKAFYGCTATKIYFSGTMSDWNQIEKSSTWNSGSQITQIICLDGII